MVSESVEKILNAEKDASQLIEKAHAEAADIIKKAKSDAASYRASVMADAVKKEAELEKDFDIRKEEAKRTLGERLLKEEENLKICLQKNNLYVEIGSTVIYSRLIEGEFVKYNHILPSAFENVVTVNKDALLSSIERAAIVARNDRFNVVKDYAMGLLVADIFYSLAAALQGGIY